MNFSPNHKTYNFLDCDLFKKTLIFHLFTCQGVIKSTNHNLGFNHHRKTVYRLLN